MKAISGLFVILNVSVCFPRVEILIPGGFGGQTKKIFQARYRSPWPPRNASLIFTMHAFHLFCKEKGCQNATVNNAIEAVLKYTNVKVDW